MLIKYYTRPIYLLELQRTKNAGCLGNTTEGHSEKQETEAGIASQVQPNPRYRQLSQMSTNSGLKQARGTLCTMKAPISQLDGPLWTNTECLRLRVRSGTGCNFLAGWSAFGCTADLQNIIPHPPWTTSPPWPQRWAPCKRGSPPQRRTQIYNTMQRSWWWHK